MLLLFRFEFYFLLRDKKLKIYDTMFAKRVLLFVSSFVALSFFFFLGGAGGGGEKLKKTKKNLKLQKHVRRNNEQSEETYIYIYIIFSTKKRETDKGLLVFSFD